MYLHEYYIIVDFAYFNIANLNLLSEKIVYVHILMELVLQFLLL